MHKYNSRFVDVSIDVGLHKSVFSLGVAFCSSFKNKFPSKKVEDYSFLWVEEQIFLIALRIMLI